MNRESPIADCRLPIEMRRRQPSFIRHSSFVIRQFPPAFTLLELIMVLVLLGIVAAAVAPSLRSFGVGRSNNDTAALIVSLANYARTQAMAEGRTYRLNFDPAGQTFWLTVESGGGFQALSSDFGKHFDAAEGSRIETDLGRQTDGSYVEFRPTGRTDAARIELTDKLGGRIEVACASATETFRIVSPAEASR